MSNQRYRTDSKLIHDRFSLSLTSVKYKLNDFLSVSVVRDHCGLWELVIGILQTQLVEIINRLLNNDTA